MNNNRFPRFLFLIMVMTSIRTVRTDEVALESTATVYRTGTELFEAYRAFREKVWIMNPPVQMTETQRREALSDTDTDVVAGLWEWWLGHTGWFMTHRAGADRLAPELQQRIWGKGDTRDLLLWEHPGEGLFYATLIGDDKQPSEDIARLKAPDWNVRERETVEAFYRREIATRRVARLIRSPHAPDPPAPPPAPMMAHAPTGSAFRLEWTTDAAGAVPTGVEVDFGPSTTPGPFVVWRHTSGDLTANPGMPGDWTPLAWMRDRPAEHVWQTDISPADHPNPAFVHATLGTLDSDGDGLDDGFELWFFGDLTETASGDYDNDGISNLEEYRRNTNPVVADTDADGRKDGDEITLGTNPEWKDHPDVELEVYIVR